MTNHHPFSEPVPTPLCFSFAELLPVLDEPAVDAQAARQARAHVATCAYCQSQLASYADLDAALRWHLGPAGTPRRHTEDVMRDLLHEHTHTETNVPPSPPTPLPGRRRPGRSRRVLSGLASLAAVLAITVLITVLLAQHRSGPLPGAGGTATSTTSTPPAYPPAGLVRGSWTGLYAISMISATEGWAAGVYQDQQSQHSVLLHDHHGVWSVYPNPFNVWMTSISMASATDGWAVGFEELPGGQLLLHYNGKEWIAVKSPFEGCPTSYVQMLSATDGWMVGCTVTGGSSTLSGIAHYDGKSWTMQSLPDGLNPYIFSGLSMISPTEGWAVGSTNTSVGGLSTNSCNPVNSVILHYKNGQWTVQSTYTDTDFNSLSMDSASDGWAVGIKDATCGSNPAFLLHYTRGTWVQVAPPVNDNQDGSYSGVSMASASDGWMEGEGPGKLLHWNGAAWTPSTLPTIADTTAMSIVRIVALPTGDAWAVGFRTSGQDEGLPTSNGNYTPTTFAVLFHYTNGAWQVVRS